MPAIPPPLRLDGHTAPVYSLAFRPDGRVLAAGEYSSGPEVGIRLWDTHVGALIQVLKPPASSRAVGAGSLAFHPDGRVLASGGIDAADETHLWDLGSGQPTYTITESDTTVCFSPDGRLLACGRDDIRLRDGQTGAELARLILDVPPEEPEETQWADLLCFSPDNLLLAASCFMGGYGLGLIWVWDVARQTRLATLRTESLVRALAFSPKDDTLIAVTLDTIQAWEARTLTARADPRPLPAAAAGFGLAAFRPELRLLATIEDSPQALVIHLVDVPTGQSAAQLTYSTPPDEEACTPLALTFSPDGRQLAVACSTFDLTADFVLLWTLPQLANRPDAPCEAPPIRTG